MLPIFINSLQTHSAEVISWSWKNSVCPSSSPPPHSPIKLQILGGTLTQTYEVDGAYSFRTLQAENQATASWRLEPTTALRTAAPDAEGTLLNLAARSRGGRQRAPPGSERRTTCCVFPVIALKRWPLDQIVFDSSESRPDQTGTSAKLKRESRHISTHVVLLRWSFSARNVC